MNVVVRRKCKETTFVVTFKDQQNYWWLMLTFGYVSNSQSLCCLLLRKLLLHFVNLSWGVNKAHEAFLIIVFLSYDDLEGNRRVSNVIRTLRKARLFSPWGALKEKMMVGRGVNIHQEVGPTFCTRRKWKHICFSTYLNGWPYSSGGYNHVCNRSPSGTRSPPSNEESLACCWWQRSITWLWWECIR